jgi:ABC-type lipoprotein release transport system permease subunit
VLAMMAVTVFAALVPAVRAARVNPIVTLRYE